jgi:hypothetical protein
MQIGASTARTNNSNWALRPFQNVNSTIISIPNWVKFIEMRGLMAAFTTNPVANTFQWSFQPYDTASNVGFGTPQGSEQLASITATQNYNNGSTNYRYYFTSTYVYSLPSLSIADAGISGFYGIIISLRNTTGGSLTTTSDNWFGGLAVCY